MRLRPAAARLTGPLLALFAASCAFDAGAPPPSAGPHLALDEQARGANARTRTITAATGLRINAIEVKGAGTVSALFSYTLTGLRDPPGKAGLAQVAALVANRGGEARGGLRADERLFAAGALFRVDADSDALRFHAVVRPQALRKVLAVEAERLRDPAAGLADAEIEAYREWAARALEEATARPPVAALAAALLPGSRYAGEDPTPASLRAVTPDDVRKLLRDALRPERAVVIVCGPEAPEPAARAVEAAYAAAVAPKPGRPIDLGEKPPRPEAVKTQLALTEGNLERPVLWLAWAIPGARSRTNVGASIAAQVLEIELGARARQGDLEDLVLDVDVEPVVGELASFLVARVSLTTQADAEKARAALATASGAAARFFRRLDWQKLRELRGDFRYQVARALETGRLEGLDLLVRAGQPDPVEDLELQGEGLLTEVPYLLEHRVRPELAAALLVSPRKKAEPLAAVEGGDTFAPAWGRAPNLFGGAAPGASELAALVGTPPAMPEERRVLPNGLTVVVRPRGAFPSVHVALFVAADSETPAARAEKRVALQALRNASPRYLASFRTRPGGFELGASGPASHLPRLLTRVAGWTWSRPRAGDAGDVVKATLEDDRAGRGGGSERGVTSLALAALTSPAGAPVSAESPVASVDVSSAVERLPRWFRPERATLVVTGQVTASEAFWNDVKDGFGRWKGEPPPLEEPPAPPGPDRRRVLLLDYPGAQGGSVHVFFRTPPPGERDHGTYLSLVAHLDDVANGIAVPVHGSGGVGGREGARVNFVRFWFGGRRAELPAALAAYLGALEKLRATPIPPPDLDLARWTVARWLAYGFDDLESSADVAGRTALGTLTPGWLEGLPASLAAATPAKVQALARELLGREVIVVAGDAATLAPEIRKLGLAPEVLSLRAP